MRRIITIIIIILVVVGLFLTGSWLLSRRSATQNGKTPQSFREFITGTSAVTPSTGTTGDLSSDFTNPPTPTQGSTPISRTEGTETSTFTNTNLSPAGSTPETSSGGGVVAPGNTNNNTTPGNNDTTPPATPGTGTAVVPDCSDADLNITFTPAELARLKTLQNRFYAVADTLYTDANVSTEDANHTSFVLKTAQITDLYNYCATLQPGVAVSNPYYAYRVPTPFWYDPSKPNGGPNNTFTGYLNIQTQTIGLLFNGTGALLPGPQGVNYTKKRLEGSLRLNLW